MVLVWWKVFNVFCYVAATWHPDNETNRTNLILYTGKYGGTVLCAAFRDHFTVFQRVYPPAIFLKNIHCSRKTF